VQNTLEEHFDGEGGLDLLPHMERGVERRACEQYEGENESSGLDPSRRTQTPALGSWVSARRSIVVDEKGNQRRGCCLSSMFAGYGTRASRVAERERATGRMQRLHM
jgi:hypothetical protein